MPHGQLTAFFLFEVGDAIDLEAVGAQIDVTVSARLAPRPATPPYVQYQQPPLTMDGGAIGLADVQGFHVRLKAFDYGVISVAFTRELPDAWDALLESGLEWQEDGRLEKHAERLCRELLARIAGAVTKLREGQFLNEDYFVFTVFSDGSGETAEALLSTRGNLIAQLLRNERQQLSSQEREEVLRHRLSYYTSDVVVATWNSALVYDSQSGASGGLAAGCSSVTPRRSGTEGQLIQVTSSTAAANVALRARPEISAPFWPPMHPAGLRCSSLTYARYARSSRLAGRAPRRPAWRTYFRTGREELTKEADDQE
jgi:hypothetical protein